MGNSVGYLVRNENKLGLFFRFVLKERSGKMGKKTGIIDEKNNPDCTIIYYYVHCKACNNNDVKIITKITR